MDLNNPELAQQIHDITPGSVAVVSYQDRTLYVLGVGENDLNPQYISDSFEDNVAGIRSPLVETVYVEQQGVQLISSAQSDWVNFIDPIENPDEIKRGVIGSVHGIDIITTGKGCKPVLGHNVALVFASH